MQKIEVSETTQRAINELILLHKQGKLFTENQSLHRDSSVRDVVDKTIQQIGFDIKKHVGIQNQRSQ